MWGSKFEASVWWWGSFAAEGAFFLHFPILSKLFPEDPVAPLTCFTAALISRDLRFFPCSVGPHASRCFFLAVWNWWKMNFRSPLSFPDGGFLSCEAAQMKSSAVRVCASHGRPKDCRLQHVFGISCCIQMSRRINSSQRRPGLFQKARKKEDEKTKQNKTKQQVQFSVTYFNLNVVGWQDGCQTPTVTSVSWVWSQKKKKTQLWSDTSIHRAGMDKMPAWANKYSNF